jgi:imidazolonepropionase-like amidohydrolase
MAGNGRVIIRDGSVLDAAAGELVPDQVVTVEGGDVVEVVDSAQARTDAGEARVVDVGGRVVMSGLIDCHVHVLAFTANLAAAAEQSSASCCHSS